MRFGSWFVNQCFSSFLKSSQHPSQNRRRVFIVATVDEQPPRLFVALLDDLNDFHEASVISRICSTCSRNKETKQCSEGTAQNQMELQKLQKPLTFCGASEGPAKDNGCGVACNESLLRVSSFMHSPIRHSSSPIWTKPALLDASAESKS